MLAIVAMAGALALGSSALAQQNAQSTGPYYGMGPGMMGWGGGFGGMGMGMLSRYPDGYIAFLKAELGITSAQEAAWSKLADALRAESATFALRGPGAAAGRGVMGPGMMGQGGYGPGMMWSYGQNWQPPALTESLDQQVDTAEQRLTALKAVRDAAKPLYGKLTSDQKQKADRLLGCPGCFW